MEKIVEKGLKVDLHIHSKLSKHKDGSKVDFNTLENLPTLIKKLKDNNVNICSITDHDAFDFSLYKKLKDEEEEKGTIRKVLPGVEFSVLFESKTEKKVIHIVTIFDDRDENKINKIQEILKFAENKPCYDTADFAFSEKKYLELLQKINVDTIMIAHQKTSLTSNNSKKECDVSSLGMDMFNEFLFTDYFEAFEFRNKKNEIFNKSFIYNNKIEEELRFITGSDCHNWNAYPNDNISSNNDFTYTYIKSLPTFKGLIMAITDHKRIRMVDSFFNPTFKKIESIDISVNGKEFKAPLSKGINVIIGDNSIGKSLLLHEITDYSKGCKSNTKTGFKKYLTKNKIEIKTKINPESIFFCDMQGEIRDRFESNKLKGSDFLKKYFPKDIDTTTYRTKVENEFKRLFEVIEEKFEFDEKKQWLPKYILPSEEFNSQSLTFTNEVKQQKNIDLIKLLDALSSLENPLKNIEKSKEISKEDLLKVIEIKKLVKELLEGYDSKKLALEEKNKKINSFSTAVRDFKKKFLKTISDEQKITTAFLENRTHTINEIFELVNKNKNIVEFEFSLPTLKIQPNTQTVSKFEFVTKLNIEELSNDYIKNVLSYVFIKNWKIDIKTITKSYLKSIISYYPKEVDNPLDVFKSKVKDKINEDFSPKYSIIEDGMDKYQELSSGFNSQIYFTILSGETMHKGIYIIDQPEDHVSQKAIREKLIDQFKEMGEKRQVIIVTHNPQFIVNLDVDNVIFLGKENDEFFIKSGALEYEDENYSILKIIAENIEGGLDTVSRRLKRYEKGIQV